MTHEEVLNCVRIVLEGFERGKFVRGTADDHDPKWAIDLMPYLVALGKLAKAVEVVPV